MLSIELNIFSPIPMALISIIIHFESHFKYATANASLSVKAIFVDVSKSSIDPDCQL